MTMIFSMGETLPIHHYGKLLVCIITKLPDSGDLCGNITEFGVVEDDPPPPKQSDIAIQISRGRVYCFYILLFNDFMSFSAKVYEINMYLLLYLSFKI